MTLNALHFPVEGMCGPKHKSMKSPHLYADVKLPSGTLFLINDDLNSLYWNSSSAWSFVNTSLSNLKFFLINSNDSFSTFL